MTRIGQIIYIIAVALYLSQTAKAETPRVSFITCYPGSDIYELEGHSAIRVEDENYDIAISYGMFDFNSPNFVYRFVKGETDYYVGAIPWTIFLNSYAREGRTVVEQVIDLDSTQTARLIELLNDNLKPQNAVYRYNYVKDNCATRPLRMIEKALGDSIILSQPKGKIAQARSFRDAMRMYHKNYPWYQFGIDLALGSGIDYALLPREKSFSPVALESQLSTATAGNKPVVKATNILSEGHDVTLDATPWYLTPIAIATLLLAICIIFSVRDMRLRKVTKWLDAILYTVFGLAGCLIAFLVFISVHEATSPNWLIIWLNPFCLIVPIFIWLKKCKTVVMSYQIVNFALILVFAVAWPFSGQSGNTAFVPLILCDALRAFSYIYININNKKAS